MRNRIAAAEAAWISAERDGARREVHAIDPAGRPAAVLLHPARGAVAAVEAKS